MAASFASPRFETFIPYAPPEPKTARRPPSKEASACSPEWLSIDEMVKALGDQGDKFLDTLAATPSFDALEAGIQPGDPQNALEVNEHDESATSKNGAVSVIATPSMHFLSPADDASGPQPAFGEDEERILERHDCQPESPHVMVDLLDDTIENAVVQSAQMSEYCDGTPLADIGGVLRIADGQQDMDDAQPAASKDARNTDKQPSEPANKTYLASGNVRSSPKCSIADLDSPPPTDDSMSDVWSPGTSSAGSGDNEIEPCQSDRARWHRKQHSPYSRERVTPSISKRRGSWRVRKAMWSRGSPQCSSKSKRTDLGAIMDAPRIPPDSTRTRGELIPQKLLKVTLRRLASGETFMTAIIQDERKVAAFAYDQSVTLIKRSTGCNQEVDGLDITSISLNSWLLTGLLRMDDDQDPHPPTRSGHIANDEIDELPVERICNPHAEHAELDRLTDLLQEAASPDDDGSIEDLQYDDDDKPRDTIRHRKPPWTPKEEQILADLVDHKTWEEIGELLGRPPGGVSQRWRKMQLDAADGKKHQPKRKRNKVLCES